MSRSVDLWRVAVALLLAAEATALVAVVLDGSAGEASRVFNSHLLSGVGPILAVLSALAFLAARNRGPTVRPPATRRVLLALAGVCVAGVVLALLHAFGVDTWARNWSISSDTAAFAALGWALWRPVPWRGGTRIAIALVFSALGMMVAGPVHGWIDATALRTGFGDEIDQSYEGSALLFSGSLLAVLALAFYVHSRRSELPAP